MCPLCCVGNVNHVLVRSGVVSLSGYMTAVSVCLVVCCFIEAVF